MSEYIIDMSNSSYQSTSDLLCADVSQLREEIVRCRDCRFCVKRGYRLYCDLNTGGFPEVEPDGFCSWGEKEVD